MTIDTHVHFWDPVALDYAWLDGTPLNRPYLPEHLEQAAGGMPELIMVQADCAPDQARREVEWVRQAGNPLIRGIVAYAPLESGADALIAEYATDPFVLGVRRNIQNEAPGFATQPEFVRGVGLLGDSGLTFDACVRHHQIGDLIRLAEACPQTTIVLDHLGKPPVKDDGRDGWRADLAELAGLPHVYCKLSGLVTEADPDSWTVAQIRPYLDDALDLFGPRRCMFGSDWPVVDLAADYRTWRGIVTDLIDPLSEESRYAVLEGTARRAYRLTT